MATNFDDDDVFSELNCISADNDFVDLSSVNILAAQHPFRESNMENFKRINPSIDFDRERKIHDKLRQGLFTPSP